ncbi:2OG-Fe(II) oxygenase [Verminephrobacter aporrectodeae subsp. tuberculatae]|uniref:2OG-Fe(II) oxygenase n=1 Tax=Verminephrobacter aporrectodeae subsp. tuberculatae TaxID=1110392 RepID=A0ABT3KV35_9BURK|nr:2OG-Fe(II) oxygenase [Verminephrobacter aporrectodeae]MCW5322198.1 2OG-Fe(II) oxygenase [Verminephrobacter aporrectodeae subsp. tuberculatae]
MQNEITRKLAEIISTIRCHGDFYASGRTAIIMPNLDVDGVGRIALPLLDVQGDALVRAADRAPYGRGEDTLVDTAVRRTWQIDADRIHLSGHDWPRTLERIVAQAADGLGVTAPVTAQLYKLLIYDTGSFFVEHRDTEKAPGMFATLVLALPSASSGGELVVRHRGREVCLDLGGSDSAVVSFATFYADCVHEVRPVTSGFRPVLIYNLVRTKGRQASAPPVYDKEQSAIAALLRRWGDDAQAQDVADGGAPKKVIYPLEHAYTQAELAFGALKNADAAAASVLVRAAAEADCELYLALVSIEEMASAEYIGYGRDYGRRHRDWDEDEEGEDDDDGDGDGEDYEVGDIIERDLTVSDWRHPDGSRPAIHSLPFQEDELCPPEYFDDLEPDEQHFHEATGNAGATLERTYRQAAFVLWPRAQRMDVLSSAGLHVTLPYLRDLAARWERSGADQGAPLWCEAHALAACMLRDWPGVEDSFAANSADKVNSMLKSLAQLRDTESLDALLSILPGIYNGGENKALAGAARLLPAARVAECVGQIIAWNAQPIPGICADLLLHMCSSGPFGDSPELLHPAATVLVQTLTGQRTNPARPGYSRRPEPVTSGLVEDLFRMLAGIDAPALDALALAHVLQHPVPYDLDAVLVPAVLALSERASMVQMASVQRMRAACLTHLRKRIGESLQPPKDFARANSLRCACRDCAELGRFLEDPQRERCVLKAGQAVRGHVEDSIRTAACDLDCETSQVGRPYSLICTKNQASYQRGAQQRMDDLRKCARMEADGTNGGPAGEGAGPSNPD